MPLTRAIARGLIGAVIPERGLATITLSPAYPDITETVTVGGAWMKPVASSLKKYSYLQIQADETLIKIPDSELNPANNGREIRAGDRIVFGGETYNVTGSGSTEKTVLTEWMCVCRKVLPSS